MIKERLSIGLDKPAMTWLKREAKRLGISIGELIRRIIDNVREQSRQEAFIRTNPHIANKPPKD